VVEPFALARRLRTPIHHRTDAESEIRRLLGSSTFARAAVAYWGAGAVEQLEIEKLAGRDAIIVCDLMSGACNPGVIEKLQTCLGHKRVLTRDYLHAKIWLTDKGAIVGSSNASASGLGFEGGELRSSIEANVFTDDPTVLTSIEGWFDGLIRGSKEISADDMKLARIRWKHRRAARPRLYPGEQTASSLLGALRTTPEAFADRNFIVWVYSQGTQSKEAERITAAERVTRGNKTIQSWEDPDSPLPPAGALVLEFDLNKDTRRATLDGLWQVLKDDPLKKTKRGNLLLCKHVPTVAGLPLGDRKSWEAAASNAAKTGREEWPIEEFSRLFLRSTS
jgi:hypothetical protein